jgi:transcriptional regulator with XRE-family HTH domain
MTRFCRLRRFLGLTQLDLEIATGISVRRISLAENGSITLTEPEECAIFEYLADRLRIVRELEASLPARCASSRANSRETVFGPPWPI